MGSSALAVSFADHRESDLLAAIDEIDAGIAADTKARAEGERREEKRRHGPRFMLPDADESPVEQEILKTGHPVLATIGFLLMASLGAGAAALVFHDRVTQIVAQFNGGR